MHCKVYSSYRLLLLLKYSCLPANEHALSKLVNKLDLDTLACQLTFQLWTLDSLVPVSQALDCGTYALPPRVRQAEAHIQDLLVQETGVHIDRCRCTQILASCA